MQYVPYDRNINLFSLQTQTCLILDKMSVGTWRRQGWLKSPLQSCSQSLQVNMGLCEDTCLLSSDTYFTWDLKTEWQRLRLSVRARDSLTILMVPSRLLCVKPEPQCSLLCSDMSQTDGPLSVPHYGLHLTKKQSHSPALREPVHPLDCRRSCSWADSHSWAIVMKPSFRFSARLALTLLEDGNNAMKTRRLI